MSRAPRLTGTELLQALAGAGFRVVRIRGSHHILRHENDRSTVVPIHGTDIIGPGLLHKILRDCAISMDELD